MRDNRSELKTIKGRVKDLTERCNLSKKNIDAVKTELDRKQEVRKITQQQMLDEDVEEDEAHEIIDEDELQML